MPDTGASGVNSHIGYTGAMTDANGLFYLNARYYAPGLGNFMNSDPLAGKPADPGSFNLYTYVRGNPVIYTDPSVKDCQYQGEFCPQAISSGETASEGLNSDTWNNPSHAESTKPQNPSGLTGSDVLSVLDNANPATGIGVTATGEPALL